MCQFHLLFFVSLTTKAAKNILCNAISVNLCFKAYFLFAHMFFLKDSAGAVLCFTLDGVCPWWQWKMMKGFSSMSTNQQQQRQRRTKRREACQGKTEGISFVSSNLSLYYLCYMSRTALMGHLAWRPFSHLFLLMVVLRASSSSDVVFQSEAVQGLFLHVSSTSKTNGLRGSHHQRDSV